MKFYIFLINTFARCNIFYPKPTGGHNCSKTHETNLISLLHLLGKSLLNNRVLNLTRYQMKKGTDSRTPERKREKMKEQREREI
jgi:hypothetical protein